MNQTEKFLLKMQLKEKFPALTDELLYEIVSELDKLKVLSTPQKEKTHNHENTSTGSKNPLPKSFIMISPLWSGEVRFKTQGTLLGYEDENGNFRLYASTEKDLIKKVKKYKKD